MLSTSPLLAQALTNTGSEIAASHFFELNFIVLDPRIWKTRTVYKIEYCFCQYKVIVLYASQFAIRK